MLFRLFGRTPGSWLDSLCVARSRRTDRRVDSIDQEFLSGVLGHAANLGTGRQCGSVASRRRALLLLVTLGSAAFNYDSQVSQQKIVKAIELGTMERVIRLLLTLSVGFLDRRTHGDLLQSVRQDVSQLRSVILATASIASSTSGHGIDYRRREP